MESSTSRSAAEKTEREALGLPSTTMAHGFIGHGGRDRPSVSKHAIHAPEVLNEATDYASPTSFSRGLRVEAGATLILISGTASVGSDGATVHPGDFRAQCWRTYRNLTRLLEAAGATWHDVVRCRCYLRDIERDYADFNDIRTELFSALGLAPLPASTAIQARLCRSDLLIEIEADAILGFSSRVASGSDPGSTDQGNRRP